MAELPDWRRVGSHRARACIVSWARRAPPAPTAAVSRRPQSHGPAMAS